MSTREDALGPMQRDMLGELRRRYDASTAEAGLGALREEIAHELAEEIRFLDREEPDDYKRPQAWLDGFSDGVNAAANLIDSDTP